MKNSLQFAIVLLFGLSCSGYSAIMVAKYSVPILGVVIISLSAFVTGLYTNEFLRS